MSKPARFLAVEEEVVSTALAAQYEQGIKVLLAAMSKNGLGAEHNWNASQHNQSYFYSFAVDSLSDLDPATGVAQSRFEQLLTAIESDAAKEFAARSVPPVLSSRLSVVEWVEEFTYQPANSVVSAPKLAILDVHRVRADKIEQYKDAINRLLDAVSKVEYPIGWVAWRTVIGEGKTFYGVGRDYTYVVEFDGHAQFYEQHSFAGALEKALGVDGAGQLLLDERQCLLGMEAFEHRLRPDLSYRA